MGKSKDTDVFHRMNFLYQASNILLGIQPKNTELSRFYSNTMMKIGTKNLMKIDPNVKRTICKICSALLVPGVTAKVRMRCKRETHIVWTCMKCGTMKRFMCRKGYQLWCEKTEATNHRCKMEEDADGSNKDNVKFDVTQCSNRSVNQTDGGVIPEANIM